MTIDKIRELLHAQPFRPFVVHLADGRQVPVHHPDFVAAAPPGRLVVILQPDESMNIVDSLLVTDLELRPNGTTIKSSIRVNPIADCRLPIAFDE